MIRKFKLLGLAMVAVLAMSATAASSASAIGKFTSPAGYPQHLSGVDIGAVDTFTATPGAAVSCNEESYTANLGGATGELSVTPSFKHCTTPGGEFTVLMNGCTYTFKVTETVAADHDKGTMAIVCPAGQVMETHQYASPQNHAAKITNCKITTGAQATQGALNFTSETASKDLHVHGEVKITSQLHGQCSFGFTINVESGYHLGVTFQSTSGAAVHIG